MYLLTWIATFFSFCCLCLADNRPSISETIIQETKRVGETAILNCTVVNQGGYQTQWSRGNAQGRVISRGSFVEISLRYKYQVKVSPLGDNKLVYSLYVFNLERVDDGDYVCSVNVDSSASDPRMVGKLVVNLKPSINLADSSPPIIYAMIGQSFTLKCAADGQPKPRIYFKRVQGSLPDGNITRQGSEVTFHNVTKAARGIYQCHADNAVDEGDTYLITVKIGFRPATKPVQTSYGQKRDKLVLLECRVSGEPEPDLNWYQIVDGERRRISDNQKYEIAKPPNYNPVYDISELFYNVLFEVSADDYGYYECEATNKYGTDSSRIEVFEAYDLCQGGFCLSLRGEETSAAPALSPRGMLCLLLPLLALASGRVLC